MPQNKKHHFVPQFYLRNFARDEARKTVRLLNIKRDQFVDQASIRGQCHRDHFYGSDDRMEKAIGQLEGLAAGIISDAIISDVVPAPFTKPHRRLTEFLAVQLGRTEAAEANINEAVDKMAKHMLKRMRPDLEQNPIRLKRILPS